MPDTEFYRELLGGLWNAVIKGTYHEDSARPISEECMGDWMNGEFAKVVKNGKKILADWSAYPIEDAYATGKILVDMHYKNMEACQFERVGDEMKHWCLDDLEKCIGFHGIVEQTWESGPLILSKLSDLWDLMNTDDMCYSDSELITEAERAVEDIMSIWASVRGF